uniref:Serine and arginine rich splicing factor 11 n=1 Tax=Oryzias latipes TaxID=8090 RepID=A0A3B3IJU0_ORYLA
VCICRAYYSNKNTIYRWHCSARHTLAVWKGQVLCFRSLHNISFFSFSDSPLPVTSRVCFVKFLEPESVGVSQHLTNTVFVDRALIVVPFAEVDKSFAESPFLAG